ncbi:MAG: acyl-CoA reductase [Deltaproteobacteria bacterium]|nr:acyl-CoA reductase [Deltaproteobacteria bacterium]
MNPRAASPPVSDQLTPTTAARLTQSIAALRSARAAVAARSLSSRLAALDAVVEDWLRPDSPWMARAVERLPPATGFSAAMIRFALPALLEPLRAAPLERLVTEEAARGEAPALILHILPGNLPGLAAIPSALSLAIGSATLLKAGRGDRVFPLLWLSSLAAHDAELAAAAAAVYWPGGERDCEALALAAADLVVAAGDDDSIAALAARARARFIGHGHRISFAVVTAAAAADPATVEGLAVDVATWDQRGCLSPQLGFIQGDFDAACELGARLSDALGRLAVALPPATMTIGERLAVRRWRDEAEWAGFGGERYVLFAQPDEGAGTVVVEPQAVFRPSPLGRSLRLLPIGGIEDLQSVLRPVRALLEGAGLAAGAGQYADWESALVASGVHLVSRIGAMQRPPLAWRQGGRPRLADWLVRGAGVG